MSKQMRDLVVRIDAETKSFEGGMQRSSSALRGMQGELRALERRQAKQHQAMGDVGKAGVAMGAALAAGIGLSVKAAVDWERAWTGVLKTTTGSARQMAALEGELRDMAKTLPVTHAELAGIAEAAGQLGIKREAIAGFTRTVVDLGSTTDLSFDEAATSLAQFANVMRVSDSDFDRMGAALVDLGNNGASTESQIMAMALRLAGAGQLIDASADEVLALASSMADLGIQAELGGGAMSRVLLKIYSGVQEGGDSLQGFADLAGMTAQEFASTFGTAPVEAVDALVQGLGRVKDEGGNVVGTLGDLGIEGTQNLQVMLALAGAGDGLTQSLERGSAAWEANEALVKEAEKRYETTDAKLQMARNSVTDLAISVGSTLLPLLAAGAAGVAGFADAVNGLPEPAKALIAIVGTLGAVVGVLGGSALIATTKLAALKGALTTLNVSAETTDKTMSRLSLTMKGGLIAGAVVGIAVAVDQLVNVLAAPPPKLNALTDSLADFAREGRATGELLGIVGDDFVDVGEKIARAADNKWTTWEWGMGPAVFEIQEVRDELDRLDETLAGLVQRGNGDAAAEAFGRIAEKAEASDVPVEDLNARFDDYGEAVRGASAESKLAEDGIGGVGDAASAAAPKVEELTDAQKALEGALSSFVDPLGTYTEMVREMAEQTAAGTKDAKDSWSDYADTAVVALDDLAARLEADNAAHVEWKNNLVQVARTAGPEVAQILAEMGEEGVRLTAQMADGTDAEVKRMAAALIEQAALGGSGAARQLDAELQVMAAIAAAGGKATVDSIAAQLQLGTAQVAAIAAQYGVKLTEGINPVLLSLGRPGILAGTSGRARHYADGGFEDHVAQIAQPGVIPRVWAERETGGEAYIPQLTRKAAACL